MVRDWLNAVVSAGGEFPMFVRVAIVVAGVLAATPSMMAEALAEPMNADMARRFVVGKTFAYNCFDGTRGAGRIYSDGSVAGSIQLRGSGPVRFVTLPPGTLQVKGQIRIAPRCAACRSSRASISTVPSERSFRGSVSGFALPIAISPAATRAKPRCARTGVRACRCRTRRLPFGFTRRHLRRRQRPPKSPINQLVAAAGSARRGNSNRW